MTGRSALQTVLVSDSPCSIEDTRAAWTDADRRARYLLRSDVAVPISADPRVTVRTSEPKSSRRIVVTIGVGDQEGAAARELFRVFEALTMVDVDREEGLIFLGFDVCDGDLYSALLNCGYLEEAARGEARSSWASRLTEAHLLAELVDARALRAATDIRVPEHAPFFVFRVFGDRE